MSVTHELKTWPLYWDAIARGDKTFEVRKDDRAFQKGDMLKLWKFDPVSGYCKDVRDPKGKDGYVLTRRITFILRGGQFGIEPGYVVMGFDDTDHSS